MDKTLSNLVGTKRDAFAVNKGTLDASSLTDERDLELPDKDGIIATTDDVNTAAIAFAIALG